MHPQHHAAQTPDKPAYIMCDAHGNRGETVTYGEIEARANQVAHLLRDLGLQADDGVAVFMDNNARYYEPVLAADRAGLYLTAISSKLTADEVAYIVKDSAAKALIVSAALDAVADQLPPLIPGVALLRVGGARGPYKDYVAERDARPSTPIADQAPGSVMLYSSGTTGRPKGVRRARVEGAKLGEALGPLATLSMALHGATPDSVYLSPAPLYHAAPLGWSVGYLQLGATVVVMEKFDAEGALAAIQNFKVTHAQWVPTHFVRMLKLPEEVRAKYDLSSLQGVFHAAAPCPVPVKEKMIEWWGPIIHEYYAGTEGNGMTVLNSHEWLQHKGSVGKGMTAEVKICDENGDPLPPRTEGAVFFAGGGDFTYYNDEKKTAESRNKHGWTTLGDVGWVDEDGYLYLTDRKSFMIISGGVNIYPQEVENLLITHPKVADAAVVGAPHEEMGEQVVAVIQPLAGVQPGDDLAAELMAFARANLSHVKAPRRIDFMAELPRHDTGKIYKRLIRDAYWGKTPATA